MFLRRFRENLTIIFCELARWLAALLVCVACWGCDSPEVGAPAGDAGDPAEAQPVVEAPLKVIVADDPAMAASIRRWSREWQHQTTGTITLVEATSAEVVANEAIEADVLVCPVNLVGPLAERKLLVPLRLVQLGMTKFAPQEIVGHVYRHDMHWGEDAVAAPLGSPVLTICYRADLFESLAIKPPQTWPEFRAARDRLSEHAQPSIRGACEPLAPGWAGKVLLARAAAYARHSSQLSTLFDRETMAPLIASPPYVKALQQLVAMSSREDLEVDPAAALASVLDGRCAMALSWPSAAGQFTGPHAGAVSFAELPGSEEVYYLAEQHWDRRHESEETRTTLLGVAGRAAVVSRKSKSIPSAMSFAGWLSGTMGAQISPASPATTLFRRPQFESPASWVNPGITAASATQYAACLKAALTRDNWIAVPRLLSAERYEAALDGAVRRAVLREAEPAVALEQAAAEWSKITAEVGLEAQRSAYRHSLGQQ